jgi:hypothetical protein
MKISEYLHNELNSESLSHTDAIASCFDRVADQLLRKCLMTFDDRIYLLSEIEFYYHSDIHPDPYVHRHPNQLKTGLWYFHNVGQDLTFGSHGSYGGILIRGITSTESSHFADGPVKTFDELFNRELAIEDRHAFQVRLSEEPIIREEQKIYSLPRVGLYPQGREHDEEYFFKRYRYLSRPWLTRAERHVIWLYQKYIDRKEEWTEKLQVDQSMIRDYERAFMEGQTINRAEAENILSGKFNMNVLNKCRLLGWYASNR